VCSLEERGREADRDEDRQGEEPEEPQATAVHGFDLNPEEIRRN
jgi:hypothetical protein